MKALEALAKEWERTGSTMGITEWDLAFNLLPIWGLKLLYALWWGCRALLVGLGILCMVAYLRRVGNE